MKVNRSAFAGPLVLGLLTLGLVSCEVTDPGLEEEVRKLQGENKELEARLKQKAAGSDEVSAEAQSQIADLTGKLTAAEGALQELKNRFDRKRLEASFSSAVSELKLKTQNEFPDDTISQITLHEMVLPSDHPFRSGVTMVLRNAGSGQTRTIHLKGLGNINGEWSFKRVEQDRVASTVEAGAPPAADPIKSIASNTPRPLTPTPTPTPPTATPRPVNPQPIQVLREQVGGDSAPPSGGKVFKIDWGD